MLRSSISCPLICLKLKKKCLEFHVPSEVALKRGLLDKMHNASLAHRYTSRTMRSIEGQVRLKRDLYGSLRGCLHAKTSTGASFIPG